MTNTNAKSKSLPGKADFNTSVWMPEYLMRSNGLFCGFNMPPALASRKNEQGEEWSHALPPYAPRKAFRVDEYPACPANWLRSEGSLASYFLPVLEGNAMWLDLNYVSTPYHVAAVISVQGINAVSGLPCEDAHLEQYAEICPKHKAKFGPDRFCRQCKHRWPKQNYLSTTGTPPGLFWLDGFRAADGMVRQYVLTREKMRGVATHLLGSKRVFAVGISFFLSKEQRPALPAAPRTMMAGGYAGSETLHMGYPGALEHINYLVGASPEEDGSGGSLGAMGGGVHSMMWHNDVAKGAGGPVASSRSNEASVTRSRLGGQAFVAHTGEAVLKPIRHHGHVETRKLEVAAGARIRQQVYDDPNGLDYWRNNPEAVLCINYCLEEEAWRIMEAGRVDVEGSPEGFLAEIPVGN